MHLSELIPTIPSPVRLVLRNAVWAYGNATARLRPLPAFLILGAQKAGTTALYAYLREHPGITGPSWKEVSYFDRHYARGERWYRGNMPRAAGSRLVGEASPSYLLHPLAPARAAALLPGARLIAILRDPVERAYSHYQHEVALGREPLSFEDALAAEDERLRGEVERMRADASYFSEAWWSHTYRARGLYAEQLERWYDVFPREQLLVLFSEELGGETATTYRRVLDFLGAKPHDLGAYPRIYDRAYEPMSESTRTRLRAEFDEPDRQLAVLLGREVPWR
jgi:hypothetical protein